VGLNASFPIVLLVQTKTVAQMMRPEHWFVVSQAQQIGFSCTEPCHSEPEREANRVSRGVSLFARVQFADHHLTGNTPNKPKKAKSIMVADVTLSPHDENESNDQFNCCRRDLNLGRIQSLKMKSITSSMR
jgi:hypothetical protein